MLAHDFTEVGEEHVKDDGRDGDHVRTMQEEVGEGDEGLGGKGQLGAEALEKFGEGGHEGETHDDDDDDAEHDDDAGIDHGAFKFFQGLGGLFLGHADALADAGELAGLLPCIDEGEDVLGEEVFVLRHGVAEFLPPGDGVDDLGDHAFVAR